MQAMILAAGFGTRLLPFTKLRPKPLFPLLNEPLLLLIVRRLQNAGFDHIIVNCHFLREQIVKALGGISGVIVQEEKIVLGTGGGLRMALSHMRDEPLLVSNGDIYHTVNFKELYKSHESSDAMVTMAMHNYPRFNKVTVRDGFVTGFDGQDGEQQMAFTGLHVLEPDLLQAIPVAQKYSIIDRYREILQEGKKIQVHDVDGCSWTDMGTVDDYLALHGSLLKEEIPLWKEFSTTPEDSLVIDKHVDREGVSFKEWGCIGNAQLGKGSTIERCVVWD
ncbi:MAG: NTP transferase domain-containing protein, partial [Desulfocapsa sp.]|nr:NTP transferase domain-containing protein [Desulfocapsa sp.]